MKKIITYVVLLLCLGSILTLPKKIYVSSPRIFWKHMEAFESIYSEFGVDLQNQNIFMGLPLGNINNYGYCHNDGSIEINYFRWNTLNNSTKEYVIFHELGHCVLGLRHTFGVIGNNRIWNSPRHCPTTLMQARFRPSYAMCYYKNRNFYLHSLKILKRTKIDNGE